MDFILPAWEPSEGLHWGHSLIRDPVQEDQLRLLCGEGLGRPGRAGGGLLRLSSLRRWGLRWGLWREGTDGEGAPAGLLRARCGGEGEDVRTRPGSSV